MKVPGSRTYEACPELREMAEYRCHFVVSARIEVARYRDAAVCIRHLERFAQCEQLAQKVDLSLVPHMSLSKVRLPDAPVYTRRIGNSTA